MEVNDLVFNQFADQMRLHNDQFNLALAAIQSSLSSLNAAYANLENQLIELSSKIDSIEEKTSWLEKPLPEVDS